MIPFQGLYMKNLLKHITCRELTVGTVFEHLYSSFTQEEDSSVVERMKPGGFRCSPLETNLPLLSKLAFEGHKQLPL